MALTVDGVEIPKNVANALTVNGSDITDVWANGIQVWHQQLFAGQWSGNSIVLSFGGIETSGNLFRYSDGAHPGSWVSGTAQNPFSASSSYYTTLGLESASPNLLRYVNNSYGGARPYISFDFSTLGFTGDGTAPGFYNNSEGFQTSGGLMRYIGNTKTGAFISLS